MQLAKVPAKLIELFLPPVTQSCLYLLQHQAPNGDPICGQTEAEERKRVCGHSREGACMSSLLHSCPRGSYWLNETPAGVPDLAEFSRTRDFGLETWFGEWQQ